MVIPPGSQSIHQQRLDLSPFTRAAPPVDNAFIRGLGLVDERGSIAQGQVEGMTRALLRNAMQDTGANLTPVASSSQNSRTNNRRNNNPQFSLPRHHPYDANSTRNTNHRPQSRTSLRVDDSSDESGPISTLLPGGNAFKLPSVASVGNTTKASTLGKAPAGLQIASTTTNAIVGTIDPVELLVHKDSFTSFTRAGLAQTKGSEKLETALSQFLNETYSNVGDAADDGSTSNENDVAPEDEHISMRAQGGSST